MTCWIGWNASYAEFADFARQIEREGRLDDLWTDVLDNPPTQKSYGGAIGHVITHNMHHRAEAQHILHRVGDERCAGRRPDGLGSGSAHAAGVICYHQR